MSANLKKGLLYSFLFLLIFNLFFYNTFSDSDQTTWMFVLISICIAVTTLVLFLIIKRIFKSRINASYTAIDFLMLYLLSEIICLVFAGEPSLFGLMYKFHLYKTESDYDIIMFREKRDFALSVSFLTAAVLGFVISVGYNKSQEKSATQITS